MKPFLATSQALMGMYANANAELLRTLNAQMEDTIELGRNLSSGADSAEALQVQLDFVRKSQERYMALGQLFWNASQEMGGRGLSIWQRSGDSDD